MEQNRPVTEENGSSVMKTPRSSSPDHCLRNNNEETEVVGYSELSGSLFATSSEAAAELTGKVVDKDPFYKLNDGRRRVAVIFNHLTFDKLHDKIKPERKGALKDGERMEACLKKLNFDTTVYQDYKLHEILDIMDEVSSLKASEVSCVAVVVMTYGGATGGLFAKNCEYLKSQITNPLLKSATLVQVPKLFFIQASGGTNMDERENSNVDGVGGNSKKIPTHADFLMMCSTVDDCDPNGSRFIRTLCEGLEESADPSCQWDLLQMLVFVNKKMAEFDSDKSEQKKREQISIIKTTLTKFLKL